MEATVALTPVYRLVWAGKDCTTAITPFVHSFAYTDFAHGQSDELDIQLEDRGGGWKDAWYPGKGDVITASIGYLGGPMVDCGDFEIEEFEAKGPPDTVHVRALASGVSKPMRTANSKAYEGKTLSAIAGEIAAKHSLSVVGEVPEITLKRVTQNQERDLAFLKRIAERHGQVFTVKGGQLVWMERASLVNRAPGLTLRRADIVSWSIKDKGLETYKSAHVSYSDPWAKKTHDVTVKADVQDGVGDTLKLTARAESPAHARTMARAQLDMANEARFEGRVTVMGNPRLVAGVTVSISGFGKLDGDYLVYSSRHRVGPDSGYATELEVRRGA